MEMQTSAASTFNVVKNGDAAIYSSFIESQSGSRRINQLEIGTPEREFSLRSSPKKRHNNETGGKVSDKRISRLPQSIKQPFKSAFYFSPLSLSLANKNFSPILFRSVRKNLHFFFCRSLRQVLHWTAPVNGQPETVG